jgi:RNA polymerase sigma-70 factor (ECF subfamily)
MSQLLLEGLRPAAFAIAYRMLGSVSEAEDIVQEALLRLHQTLEQGEQIASPRAYLATVTTRLALDELRSARARREHYVGEWLPEPIVTDTGGDPAAQAELADSLSLAFLVVLESLSPEQRAAFLLHDVFDYGYDELATLLSTSEANARQLAARARRQIATRRPRFPAAREQHEALAQRFFAAAQQGDLGALEGLLADEVVLRGDGGGQVPALARSLHGCGRVARTLLAWFRQGRQVRGKVLQPVEVNGQPGALLTDSVGKLIGVMALEIGGGQIQAVISIVNPDKLRHLGPIGDLRGLLSST